MKNKTIISIAVATMISCPAFATGINAGAQSADCVNGTLDTYTGPASLRANWTANSITLNWYDDSTENGGQAINVPNASTTCTYDGGIVLPEDPTKTGYEFDGWKVRRAAAAPSQPQTLGCSSYNPPEWNDNYDWEDYEILVENAKTQCESHSECGWDSRVPEDQVCVRLVETQYSSCGSVNNAEECANVTDQFGQKPCIWNEDYRECMLDHCSAGPTDEWCENDRGWLHNDDGGIDEVWRCYWTGSSCEID